MSLVLPSTVEELNCMQNTLEFPSTNPIFIKDSTADFENIAAVARNYKREYSLPNGVNWNVHDFGPYLNFEENNLNPVNNFEVINSHEDRIVPGEEQRPRSESISSVASSMDDKTVVYQNMGVKTYSTLRMDSGSTCILSDPYINLTSPPAYRDLESEETFQNLTHYFSKGSEIHTTDTTCSSVSSSISSRLNDTSDYSISVLNNFTGVSNDSFSNQSISLKRSTASPDADYLIMNPSKRLCESPDSNHYQQTRKKNNMASKNCRKTRKEKQKEMEMMVERLEKDNEFLRKQITDIENNIEICKTKITGIMKPPSGIVANGIANNGVITTGISNNFML